MRVGYAPWYPTNPYQVLLKRELAARGIDVRTMRWSLRSMRGLLRRRDPLDVVHVHWPHGLYMEQYWRFPLVLLQLLLYRLLQNNVIWTVHELEFYETRYAILDRMMVRLLMRICRRLIVHSRYSERIIRSRYRFARPIDVILHPSYIECYENRVGRRAARDQLGLDESATVFLFMGHIKPYKGVEDLIQAFKRMPNGTVALCVVGQPMDPQTESQIRHVATGDNRITLDLTYVPDGRIQIYMNAADVVVLPFRKIHTSGSVLLALSFSKPVIAPAVASIPEYVDDSAAIFFDPSEPDALYAALCEAQRRDLSAMGEAGYRRVADLNWRDFAASHAAIYEELVDAKSVSHTVRR